VRRTSLALCLLALFACEDAPGPKEKPASVPPVAELRAPAKMLPSPAPESKTERKVGDEIKVEPSDARAVDAPPRACVVRSRTVLGPAARHISLVRRGTELWLLRATERALEILQLAENKAVLEHSIALKSKLSARPVGLLRADASLTLAWVDERGDLSTADVVTGRIDAPRVLVKNVDPRFSPAVFDFRGSLLVAYAQTHDEAMHTMLTRTRGTELTTRDVTPVSHGAGAPTFMHGSKAPVLVMLDARAGVSPLLEVPFDEAGEPLPAIVRTPVSQPYAPPLLSAFELFGESQVLFTAIGRAAATAVGIVSLRRAEAPRALVPSLGYGALHFDLTLGSRGAVFVSESPTAPSLDARRGLVVNVLDAQGEGPTLRVDAPEHSLSRPVILGEDTRGGFSLVYAEGPELIWVRLGCDA